MADDLGYADLGIFGSEIQTPNIDSIATGGMLFTQFHTAPLCAPTRAMLLSGNNSHVAGMAKQHQIGVLGTPVPGYENSLSNRIVPFTKLLQDGGYNTYMAGKWHLGLAPENSPLEAGFSRSFALLNGAASHFSDIGYSDVGSSYREDGELAEYPTGRYSTEYYTDRLIEYIDEGKADNKPFFAYAAYTSPHWPLQVPNEYLDLYSGHYDDGYDALRERRFESLKEAGIIPLESTLPPRNETIRPWEDLSPEERRRESRKMELYAAMLDNLDDQIGRLIEYLKANDIYENTLIVFMSDNGAAAEDFYNSGPPPYRKHIRENFDNSYELMGTEASLVSYGPQWAEAGSAPFQRTKGYSREGGIVAPMAVSGPGVTARGAINSTYLTVMDLAPTFLELAGMQYPEDGSYYPMLGSSINNLLSGQTSIVHDEDYVTTLYNEGRAYLRQGGGKYPTLSLHLMSLLLSSSICHPIQGRQWTLPMTNRKSSQNSLGCGVPNARD